jgi:hypothetical protein
MRLELQLADIVYDHKINTNASRMKMKAIKRYPLDRETYLQYASGATINLVTVFIAMYGLLRGGSHMPNLGRASLKGSRFVMFLAIHVLSFQ